MTLAAVLSACGGNDALQKHVKALETQLTGLRADQDRLEERLAALELASAVPSKAAPRADAEAVEHPRLKVIHLSPDEEDRPAPESAELQDRGGKDKAPASEDAPGRRPIIRGTGDRVIKVGDSDEGGETTRREPAKGAPEVALAKDADGN